MQTDNYWSNRVHRVVTHLIDRNTTNEDEDAQMGDFDIKTFCETGEVRQITQGDLRKGPK